MEYREIANGSVLKGMRVESEMSLEELGSALGKDPEYMGQWEAGFLSPEDEVLKMAWKILSRRIYDKEIVPLERIALIGTNKAVFQCMCGRNILVYTDMKTAQTIPSREVGFLKDEETEKKEVTEGG